DCRIYRINKIWNHVNPVILSNVFYRGLSGFLGRTAFGISSRSTGASPPSNFGGPPLRTGGSFPTGILTVAIGSIRRRIAPPRPATQMFVPPRYAIANNEVLVIVGCTSHVWPASLL